MSSPADRTVVNPASRYSCIRAGASVFSQSAPWPIGWRWLSMKPGITVIPFTSMTRAPAAVAVPAATDTILPSRTTTEPRSMAPPLPSRIRALVITRFWAAAPVAQNVRPIQTSHRFMRFSPAESIHEPSESFPGRQSRLRECGANVADSAAPRVHGLIHGVGNHAGGDEPEEPPPFEDAPEAQHRFAGTGCLIRVVTQRRTH